MNDIEDLDELDELNEERRSTPKGETDGEKRATASNAPLFKRIMRGDMLGGHMLKDQAKLILLIVACLMVIVTMRYRVESLQKEKLATEERIKVLREDRLHMQKMYQESVKISRIEEKLDTLGIGLISGPPLAI